MDWTGRVFLGEGWMIYAGPVGSTSWHRHHAHQLVLACPRTLALRSRNDVEGEPCSVAAIPSDVDHTFEEGCSGAVLAYVDPETLSGRRLRRVLRGATRASAWHSLGRPLADLNLEPVCEWAAAAATCQRMVDAVTGESVRPQPLHPAISAARRWLESQLSGGDVSMNRAAAEAGISERRLSHLFAEQGGLGIRQLVLWLRLQRAVAEVTDGRSLSEAAIAAGFSDHAHLTRTFRRMFGIAPSELTAFAQFVLPPP